MCIMFAKHTIKSAMKLILIHVFIWLSYTIQVTPHVLELPSPAALLFHRPARGILPKLSRPLIVFDQDDNHYTGLTKRQLDTDKI